MAGSREKVCVTGAGGYIASWLVKLLLARGYAVHATVRDPSDLKNAHLRQLEGASENLRVFKADVLDHGTLAGAVAGCRGVFHVAFPVPTDKVVDPETEMLAPAVKGTLNILQACSANDVQKVVVVSSTAAVHFNPKWPQDRPKDENCWSDISSCEKNKVYHTCDVFLTFLLGKLFAFRGPAVMKNILWHIVDVRDVADALLLIYKKEESAGRYICAPHHISAK
ncbi:hypothetical protein GQ55_2G304000 [Panicum hallii var. hallii]|nr:hypothetical protein GQ55_2G304000 [Panicum hallii var. hallii]